ncbi:hypothetical protein [Caldimonas brevitalea]|uniref:Uncharacterized protein n=1 Tax=Caldimonas brevitalea TaxID=413882 RepID=A0A0G3BL45_9BURK|nr:hypothetical protein [Caldimonas brevitalea]AKJ30174.1 hypothetical protein AAW51_3483 [Caldimonas brevitalea]
MFDVKLFEDLVEFQRRLVARFLALHPEAQGNVWLTGVPMRSEVDLGDAVWLARRHGAGIAFTRVRPAPPLLVDVHEKLDDPDVLDPLRVQQFVESSGAVLSYDEAHGILEAAVEAGVLVGLGERRFKLRRQEGKERPPR